MAPGMFPCSQAHVFAEECAPLTCFDFLLQLRQRRQLSSAQTVGSTVVGLANLDVYNVQRNVPWKGGRVLAVTRM